ncbi:hypothetical protein J6X15_04285 [Candidatus Saccharibacteria bacterium]|nr:hypothetical protein [Candidatus Saccharibacteria bacterium]
MKRTSKKNNKIIIWIVIAILAIIGAVIAAFFIINSKNSQTSDTIPDNYIAIFHGGSGERTYETYIYKQDNGHANSGFDYINVTSTTKEWGSSEWVHKITKRGSVQWTDNVFTVAKENNAYSFVTIPNSDKTYSIEEFMPMFLMD